MGADVFALKQEDLVFTRNWFAWRPLWDYVYQIAPDLVSEEVWIGGHENAGTGLDADGARELAVRLRGEIATGRAAAAVEEHARELAAMPDETCSVCGGTGEHGKRGLSIDILDKVPTEVLASLSRAIDKGHSTICNGSGRVRPFDAWYELREKDIVAFAEFLENCGGFEVL